MAEPASTPPVRNKVLLYRAADGSRRAFPYEEQGGVARAWPEDVAEILDTFAPGDFLYLAQGAADAWAAGPVTAVAADGRLALRFLGRDVAADPLEVLRVATVPRLELTVPRQDFFLFAGGSEHECRRQVDERREIAAEELARGRIGPALDGMLQAIGLIALWGEALVDVARRRGGPDEDLAADPARTFIRLSRLQTVRRDLHAQAVQLARRLAHGEVAAPAPADAAPSSAPRHFVFLATGAVVLAAALGAGLAAGDAANALAGRAVAGVLLLGLALGGVRVLRGRSRWWAAPYPIAMAALAGAQAHYASKAGTQPGALAFLLAVEAAAVFATAYGSEASTRFCAGFLRPNFPILIGFMTVFALSGLHEGPRAAVDPAWLVAWGAVLGAAISLIRPRSVLYDASAPVEHPAGARAGGLARFLFAAAVATSFTAAFVSLSAAWPGMAITAFVAALLLPLAQRKVEGLLLAFPIAAAPFFLGAGSAGGTGPWLAFALLCLPFALADDWWPHALAHLGAWLLARGNHRAAARVFDSLCAGAHPQREWIESAAVNCARLGDHAAAAAYLARIGAHEAAGDAYLRAVRELPCMPPPPLEPERAPADGAEDGWEMP